MNTAATLTHPVPAVPAPELPVLPCRRLDRDRVVTAPCPFCGLEHVHGEPMPGRENRLSHCSPGPRREYFLLLEDT